MNSANISFTNLAELATYACYKQDESAGSQVFSHIAGRVAGIALLSPAAALDFAFHTVMIAPACVYCLGKSIYRLEVDFLLPWQHLQRVRNAVSPLLLGSAFSLVHPIAGIWVAEPSDKYIAMGILTAGHPAPCSPVGCHNISESLLGRLHARHKNDPVNGNVITKKHVQIVSDIRAFESHLQFMHGQEMIASTSKVTELCLGMIFKRFSFSNQGPMEQVALRMAVLCIPVITVVDLAIGASMEAFFLLSGVVRLISGRGPLYTEITTNPLLHVALLTQNVFKAVGNLLAMPCWLVSPQLALAVSRAPAMLFLELQLKVFMLRVKLKMYFMKDGDTTAVPITIHNGPQDSFISIPWEAMHSTYLIIEKKGSNYDLSWVNRPTIQRSKDLDKATAFSKIESMVRVRFPKLDLSHIAHFPIDADGAQLSQYEQTAIPPQVSSNNCVASNLYGALDAVDILTYVNRADADEVTNKRNGFVKEQIQKDYSFYAYDWFGTSGEAELANGFLFLSPPGNAAV